MFVAIRDLQFAKGRFALMGAVVALISLLVVLLSGLTAGLGRGNTSAITDLPADLLVFSAPPAGAKLEFTSSSIPPAQQQEWSRVAGVRRAEPVTVALTRARAADHTSGIALFVTAPGSSLAPEATGDRAVVSTKAAASLDVGVGDTVDVAGRRLVVAEVSGDQEFSHAPVVWASGSHLRAPGQEPGAATILAVTTDDGGDAMTAAFRAADRHLGTVTLTRAQSLGAIGSYASENGSLQLMRALLLAISALVIGAFFTVWTVQRSAEIAVVKALGASTGYLLRDALGQALALLALGTAIGASLAAATGLGIRALAGSTVPFVLDLQTVLAPALGMVVLGLAGAAVSLRTVTSVDPLTTLGSAR